MSCALSTTNIIFKSAFPSFSLDNRGKKCMDRTWQSIGVTDLGPDIHVYNTHSNSRYFKQGIFLTTNNLYHFAVREIFNQATHLIQQCMDSEQQQPSFEVQGDDIEIAIIIRCISPKDPKVSYYIADHAHRSVKWLHANFPRVYNMDIGAQMRDCAEYWYHRSKFHVHRHCTPADRERVVRELDGILNSEDPIVDREEIEGYVRRLDSVPPASPLTDHQTSILAEIYSEALKYTLPAFYPRSLSLKGKLCKSLLGLSMPRFVHNRTHANPLVTQVMQEHLWRPNRPRNRRHSPIH